MTMDFERRFGGIARLYGRDALMRFANARVCVVGVGGVGSWVAEALVRSAVGGITLIDLDHVAESNINRQIQALDGTLGQAKVLALQTRMREINPDCRVVPLEAFIDEENLTELITGQYDLLFDCIDAYRTKAALIARCRRLRQRLIVVGGAGGQVDPLQIRLADLSRTLHDPLLAKTRKLLRREYGFPRNPKRRFEVPCVFSLEQQRYPAADGGVCRQKPADGLSGLNCGGYGAAMTVTAGFAMAAVSLGLQRLAQSPA